MRIVLDTNQYVEFCKGRTAVQERLQQAEHVFLPFVTVGELRAGFLCGTQSEQNERTLIRFLTSPRVSVLFADEQTTHHYARLFRQLRKQGTPIPTNDLWIAALVIQHDLALCTHDQHFDVLPQLNRV